MARGKRQLRPGAHLWGPRRAALGISLRELEAASGVNRGLLSTIEKRGTQPTGDEFDRVMAALEGFTHGAAVVEGSGSPRPEPST